MVIPSYKKLARWFNLLRFELSLYLSNNLIYYSDPQNNNIGKIKDNNIPKKFMIKFPMYPYLSNLAGT